MKKEKIISWGKTKYDYETNGFELIARAIMGSIGALLLVFSSISMFYCLPGTHGLKAKEIVLISGIVILVIGIVEPLLHWKISCRDEKREALERAFQNNVSGIAFASLLLFWIFQAKKLNSGFQELLYCYGTRFNQAFKTDFSIAQGDSSNFSLIIGYNTIVLFFMCYHLSKLGRRNKVFLLIPASGVFFTMFVGISASWGQMTAAAIGVYLISRCEGVGKKNILGATYQIGILCVLLLSVRFFLNGTADRFQARAPKTKDIQRKIEKSVTQTYFELTSPMQSIVSNAEPVYHDAKIMTVTFEDKPTGNLYFKNYVGEDYRRGAWDISIQDFQKACEENGMDVNEAATILGSSLWEGIPEERTGFRMDYARQVGAAMPLPYGSNVAGMSGVRKEGDANVKKSAFKREATFRGLSTNVFEGNTLKNALQNAYYKDLDEQVFWDWYGEYVDENCLAVPEFVWDLESFWRASSLVEKGEGNPWRVNAALSVSAFLQNNYVYGLELDDVGEDEDPIAYFLEQGGEGYCIHFASAGVLFLRALGIPARYVTGYIMLESSVEGRNDGTWDATVVDRNKHAWAEIYLDYLGWIPVEMTPGYEAGALLVPTSEEAGDQRAREEMEKEEALAGEDADKEADERGLGMEDVELLDYKGTVAMIVLGLALLLTLTLAMLWYRGRFDRRLKAAVAREHWQEAILIINRRIFHRLKYKYRIKVKGLTDKELEAAVLALAGQEKKGEISEWLRILRESAFSDHPITREQYDVIWRFYSIFLLI